MTIYDIPNLNNAKTEIQKSMWQCKQRMSYLEKRGYSDDKQELEKEEEFFAKLNNIVAGIEDILTNNL